MAGMPWAKPRSETLRGDTPTPTPANSSYIENRSFLHLFALLPNIYWQVPTSIKIWPFRNPQFQWENQCQHKAESRGQHEATQAARESWNLSTLAQPGEYQLWRLSQDSRSKY
uniref:Uncharacterized protein n=1 Tax=Mus musculus TaxID=10090 RepID=Q3V3W2_MOUSE|nr:unnamed protein product [Mus musculus]